LPPPPPPPPPSMASILRSMLVVVKCNMVVGVQLPRTFCLLSKAALPAKQLHWWKTPYWQWSSVVALGHRGSS
jgi:hypothetical protein